jgi:hypothetical protein
VWFWAGSRTSSNADDGSPSQSLPTLSISSSHDDRMQRAGFLERARDTAWQRTDVGASMTADLRLIMQRVLSKSTATAAAADPAYPA